MSKKLTEKQKKFCEIYHEMERNGIPNSHEAAKQAGFKETSAICYHAALLKNKNVENYLKILKRQDDEYSKEQYLKDLATAENLALQGKNLALYLKIIQTKAKIYGLDKMEIVEIAEQAAENDAGNPKKKKGQAYSLRHGKINDKQRQELFNKVEERSHVFEKIRHTDA